MIYFFSSRTDFTQYDKPQSLHAPDNDTSPFFGIAECIPASLRFSIDGHPGWCSVLDSVNSAALKTGVHKSF